MPRRSSPPGRAHSTSRTPLSTRAFRALLALYPAAFRDEYGRELALVFIDRYRDATGAWDRTRLWAGAVAGILTEAPQEHVRMILHDLRYAWRALRQNALVTITIVVTLALGIGANTAVFSLLNAVALRSPLPVRDAEQLHVVNAGRHVAGGPEGARLSGPMFDLLRQTAPDGVGVAAMSRAVARVHTRTDTERETTPAGLQLVSPSFFPVLGVVPSLGRALPDAGADPSVHEPVAVLSHAYWQQRFGGSPDVVGRTLTINGATFTIVGVAPRGFVGVWLETPVDIWVPLTMQPVVQYGQNFSADGADFSQPWLPQAQIWWLHVVARVPSDQVAATAGAFNASLSAFEGRDAGIALQPFARGFSRFRQQFSTPLLALMVMASLVLLTACGNVANLLLARAVGRQRELAVRIAVGAGRLRLLHQLLTESALLVVMAGAAAILFARWAGDVLLRLATATTGSAPPFAAPIDVRVLAFTAGVAFASVLAFGVWPAWRATRVDVVSALKANGRGTTGGAVRPARALVVLQVALSLVLVTGTGLFARSFQALLHTDLGFRSEHLLTIGVDPRLSGTTADALPAAYARVLDAVSRVSGVESAAFAMCGLQATCGTQSSYRVEGYQPRPGEIVAFSVNVVSPGYFSTTGMPLLGGRALTEADRTGTTPVAVVNRALATRYFGDWRQAIGRRFGFTSLDTEIVGVVEDARSLANLRAPAVPSVFEPLAQRPVVPRALEVRTIAAPAATMAAVRRAIGEASPGLPIESMEPMALRVQRGLSQERLVVWLTSGFGALALGLAGFGLFGVLSYAVARRTPELGLRLALGASRSRLLWSVVRDAVRLVIYGVLLGLPLVLIGGRLASTLFFGVSAHDPVTLAVATLVLVLVGMACSAAPARRASRVDPMAALRQDA